MDASSLNLTDTSAIAAAAAAAEFIKQFIRQLKIEKYLLCLRFLVGLGILVANGVLITAFATSAHIRNLDNILLIKLAIFDVLAGVSVILNAVANCFYPVTNSLCLTSAWMLGLSLIGSVYSLLAITVERYLKNCHPFTYTRKVNKKTMMIYILCEASFLAVITIVNLRVDGILTGDNKQVVTHPIRCSLLTFTGTSVGYQVMQYTIVGLPLIVSIVIYGRLAWITHKQRQQVTVLNVQQASSAADTATTDLASSADQNKHNASVNNETTSTLESTATVDAPESSTSAVGNHGNIAGTERKRVNMVGILLLLAYVSLMPAFLSKLVTDMATGSPGQVTGAAVLSEILQSIFVVNSLLNPIVYPFRIEEIKKAARNICRSRN